MNKQTEALKKPFVTVWVSPEIKYLSDKQLKKQIMQRIYSQALRKQP